MAGAIAQDRQISQFPFVLDENPLLYRSARPESDREARERFLVAPFARIQNERRRRLALASGFRLLRIKGMIKPRSNFINSSSDGMRYVAFRSGYLGILQADSWPILLSEKRSYALQQSTPR